MIKLTKLFLLRTLSTSCRLQNNKQIPMVPCQPIDSSLEPGADIHWRNLALHQQLGSIYGQIIGPDVSSIFISDPEMCQRILDVDRRKHPKILVPPPWLLYNKRYGVKRGLLFAEGEEWYKMRRALNPIFFKNNIFNNSFSHAVTDELMDDLSLHAKSTSSAIDDLETRMHRWSVRSALRTLFGSDYGPESLIRGFDERVFVASVKSFFAASAELQFLSAEQQAQDHTQLWRGFKDAVDTSLHMMDVLMRSFDEHSNQQKGSSPGLIALMLADKRLSQDEVRRIASDLIIAAADTTSLTAIWALHVAAREGSQMQDKLGCQDNDRFLDCFIKEVMRLYPVAPFITRILQEPVSPKPGEYPELPVGQLVLLSTFAMGRDDALFPPDASRLDPDRWSRARKADNRATAAFAWLPFGHGPRGCLGRHMALQQLKYLLRRVTTTFRLENLNEQPVEMKMRFTGIPDQDIKIGLELKK